MYVMQLKVKKYDPQLFLFYGLLFLLYIIPILKLGCQIPGYLSVKSILKQYIELKHVLD